MRYQQSSTEERSSINGEQRRKLVVKVKDKNEPPGLPNSINNINIRIKEGKPLKLQRSRYKSSDDEVTSQSSHYCDPSDENRIPGGSALSNPLVEDQDDPYFTSTCPVLRNGELSILTAGHAFGTPSECGYYTNLDVYQGENMDYIGSNNEDVDIDGDYGFVELINGINPYDAVKKSSTETVRISGHVTENGMEYHRGNTVYKYGSKTCRTSGTLGNSFNGGHCSDDYEWYGIDDLMSENGDSGSPHYILYEDSQGCEWASIVGVHLGDFGDTEDSFGCAAYEITDRESVEFGYAFNGHCDGTW